jgi:uncharacterized membrane protein YphA (DoxX/SURF4 family)
VVLRIALGGFFLYASLDKIAHPAAFAKVVYQWQVTGPVASNLVAVILPWVEALAGVLLIAGLWRREAAVVIAALLVVFLLAAGSVLARGIDVENCGCTSVSAHAPAEKSFFHGVGTFLILRNLAMLGGALVLAFVEPKATPSALAS